MAVVWASLTRVLEIGWGMPQTREQWFHRMVGWFVEGYLIRSFYRGMRHCAPALARA